MAQNQKRRRRKRRGTQGGSIDTRRRASRPRSREEAKARARSGRGSARTPRGKEDLPPTWRNSIIRGLFAAVIFAVLLMLIFKRPVGTSLIFGAFMLAFYIPTGYYIDLAMWRKRERKRIRERSAAGQ
ncbi:MAG TPA: hypothetical protein VEB65_00340 [Solirubrobacterales bacterium]|nr:hypothetical protein [Solirubrobacterales bacterium]